MWQRNPISPVGARSIEVRETGFLRQILHPTKGCQETRFLGWCAIDLSPRNRVSTIFFMSPRDFPRNSVSEADKAGFSP
ncbi:MAG: hypothetical protein HC849_20325 [Oscillatoriales cyanobacterium RU_3_3]|nr:hypothetical protein [Microcoleus sp. SU_5_6]NJL66873.1 hypothetical protein [Microcoleus sp. SM1_3_4]NJM62012.1 hypothetical protein [Oscillatoriales cyanobacterium RU_3_3]